LSFQTLDTYAMKMSMTPAVMAHHMSNWEEDPLTMAHTYAYLSYPLGLLGLGESLCSLVNWIWGAWVKMNFN
jgi:hypothetical protein